MDTRELFSGCLLGFAVGEYIIPTVTNYAFPPLKKRNL